MISIFKNSKAKVSERNLSELSYFDGVKTGQWQDEVLAYRNGKLEKTSVTAITPSGIFNERKSQLIKQHSGFICLDIDAKDQIAEIDIQQIKEDQYTYAVHKSVGGFGYCVFIKIVGEKHLESFLGLENYYFINFSIVIDKSCKDTSRLRFVSYDPDLFINDKAKTFKKYLKKLEVKQKQVKQIVVKSDFDEMVNKASTMNLFDSYDDYIMLAFALVSEFNESGRSYFHSLCSASSKYDQQKADKDYTTALKRNESGITIASVYYKFKEAGINLTSERTEQIKAIVKLSDNPVATLKELNIEDSEGLVEKLKVESGSKTDIDLIVDLIKMTKVRFNEITRNFEFGNEEMNDRVLAKFYTQVWTKIDENISKDKIFTLIQNKDNTDNYNPILNWFKENENLPTNNEFQKLIDCFQVEHSMIVDNKETIISDYLELFLKKWLLGLIGSAHGTYSLMILVLSGEQGIKKTEFFRNLLPQKLRWSYSESNLDEGKDSEILMTKKWLIIDDEFGGKSKKDATKLKRLSSQQRFSIRMPYGRVSEDLNRLAVLGGTSNDSEVINDPTGNRRIIPVNMISFDIDSYLAIDKDKLFIELYNEWKKDKTGWFLTKNEVKMLNNTTTNNTEVMAEVEVLQKHIDKCIYTQLTNTEIKLAIEKIYPSFRTNTKRIGQALKICGFEQKMVLSENKMKRVYSCQLINV